MDYFEFEKHMLKHDLKFNKKIANSYLFSMLVSIAVICINVPLIIHNHELWMNAACSGMMLYNVVWCLMEFRLARNEIKQILRRETIYKEFELKQNLDPIPSEHVLDSMFYMSGTQPSSGLPK